MEEGASQSRGIPSDAAGGEIHGRSTLNASRCWRFGGALEQDQCRMDTCCCSPVQMGWGATPALDLSWFMDLQANCLSREWEMPPPVVPLPCRGPLHPKISRKLAELSVPALSNCRGNISLLSTRLGTLL